LFMTAKASFQSGSAHQHHQHPRDRLHVRLGL
jgi:hypothetical protein